MRRVKRACSFIDNPPDPVPTYLVEGTQDRRDKDSVQPITTFPCPAARIDYNERLLGGCFVGVALADRASYKVTIEIGVLGDRAKVADFWFLVGHCTSQRR